MRKLIEPLKGAYEVELHPISRKGEVGFLVKIACLFRKKN